MKKILGTTFALAVMVILASAAQAVIKIEVSEVQDGVAFIKGNGAAKGAAITREGLSVTTANENNGGFSFFGILPSRIKGSGVIFILAPNVRLVSSTQAASFHAFKAGHSRNSRPKPVIGWDRFNFDSTYQNIAGLLAITVAFSSDSIRSRHFTGSSTAPWK
jgi:hypothetical protein